jgi:hypothetical protein
MDTAQAIDSGPYDRQGRHAFVRWQTYHSTRLAIRRRLQPKAELNACGEVLMEQFIHRENLQRLRRLLAETADDSQRQQILKLLAEEEAKDKLILQK